MTALSGKQVLVTGVAGGIGTGSRDSHRVSIVGRGQLHHRASVQR